MWLEGEAGQVRRVSLRNFERIDGVPGTTVLGPCEIHPFVGGPGDGSAPNVRGITPVKSR